MIVKTKKGYRAKIRYMGTTTYSPIYYKSPGNAKWWEATMKEIIKRDIRSEQ